MTLSILVAVAAPFLSPVLLFAWLYFLTQGDGMAAPTIQDVEKSAADLGTAIASFDTADQSAKASRAQADAADAAAVGQEAASATAKQSLIDSHEAFDTVLTAFLATLPH